MLNKYIFHFCLFSKNFSKQNRFPVIFTVSINLINTAKESFVACSTFHSVRPICCLPMHTGIIVHLGSTCGSQFQDVGESQDDQIGRNEEECLHEFTVSISRHLDLLQYLLFADTCVLQRQDLGYMTSYAKPHILPGSLCKTWTAFAQRKNVMHTSRCRL